jgi:hypothetical protein
VNKKEMAHSPSGDGVVREEGITRVRGGGVVKLDPSPVWTSRRA